VRVGGDRDFDAGRVRQPGVLGGKIKAVGVRIDLEETPVLPGVSYDPQSRLLVLAYEGEKMFRTSSGDEFRFA
jgi:hypothetical protein